MTPIITLNKFMIFNSSEGKAESQEADKLIYHWTKDAIDCKISLEEQVDDICLCDATISFSSRISSNIVHNQKDHRQESQERFYTLTFSETLIVICEVEPELSIWTAAHVSAPITSDTRSTASSDFSDDIQSAEPQSIPSDAIVRVLRNLYNIFCINNGRFGMIANQVSIDRDKPEDSNNRKKSIRDKLREITQRYYNEILPETHLHSIISNLSALYQYVIYQNLSLSPLMKVNSFMNHLVSIEPNYIEHSIVIFNDQLIWSSLSLFDTRLVFNYLVSDVIKKALREELTKEVDKVRILVEGQVIYLTNDGDTEFLEQEDIKSTYLSMTGKILKPLYMSVFRSSNNMTLGLLMNEPNLTELIESCEQILTRDSRLGVIPLWSLAQSVGQNFLKQANPQQQSGGNTDAGQASSASGVMSNHNKRKDSLSISISMDLKYLVMDRIEASFTWPKKIDIQSSKDHPLTLTSALLGRFGTKSQRFVRWLIELEPEINAIGLEADSTVEEILAKSNNDMWLMVTNSTYRTIYSLNKFKNSVLSDVHHSAMTLKTMVTSKDI